jgi:hypothetical protein
LQRLFASRRTTHAGVRKSTKSTIRTLLYLPVRREAMQLPSNHEDARRRLQRPDETRAGTRLVRLHRRHARRVTPASSAPRFDEPRDHARSRRSF